LPEPCGLDAGLGVEQLMVFIETGYSDPDIYLTDTGNLNITPATSNLYELTDSTNGNSVIDRIGAFDKWLRQTLKPEPLK